LFFSITIGHSTTWAGDAVLSVIIPVLNEAPGIVATLDALQPLRAAGHEIIVADGGSTDDSRERSIDRVDAWVPSPRGRAVQMNAGAARARGDVLLFLHADTALPPGFERLIEAGVIKGPRLWGRFDVNIEGESRWLGVIAWFMNQRSRLTGIATGDQAIFVRRAVFESIDGYAPIPLMEDIELCSRLKRLCAPLCLRAKVRTSGRRWEKHGVFRVMALMWWLRFRYFVGAPPEELARVYYRGDGK
jgi:rSAM/selenodomain-associated transferase 2